MRAIGISPLFLTKLSSGFLPPNPPYLLAVNNDAIVNTITGLMYIDGEGPSNASSLFKILGAGLVPATGIITVTPSNNIEFSNNGGITWYTTAQTFPYSGGALDTGMTYLVRLISGLAPSTYNGTLFIEGQTGINVSPFTIAITGQVFSNLNYTVATGGDNVIIDGDYKVLEFFNVDDLKITSAPLGVTAWHHGYAGGGGGGFETAGGGGNGGYYEDFNFQPMVGIFPIVPGNAGLGGINSNTATNGGDTTFHGITCIGGGHGSDGGINNAANGGGGGGAGRGIIVAGTGTSGQGNNGGIGGSAVGTNMAAGGGGGGFSTDGTNGLNNPPIFAPGAGGFGITSNITGVSTPYCGGGGGGFYTDNAQGGPGRDGGGDGGGGVNLNGGNAALRSGAGGGGGGLRNTNPIFGNGGNAGGGAYRFRFKFQN